MTQRYDRKFINARFALAMDVLGVPHGAAYVDGKAQVGVYFLDFNSVYGGYRIAKIANEGGGESAPFGTNRLRAAEFATALGFIMDTVELVKARH